MEVEVKNFILIKMKWIQMMYDMGLWTRMFLLESSCWKEVMPWLLANATKPVTPTRPVSCLTWKHFHKQTTFRQIQYTTNGKKHIWQGSSIKLLKLIRNHVHLIRMCLTALHLFTTFSRTFDYSLISTS